MVKRTVDGERFTLNRRTERSTHGWIWPEPEEMATPETARKTAVVVFATRQQRRYEVRKQAKLLKKGDAK